MVIYIGTKTTSKIKRIKIITKWLSQGTQNDIREQRRLQDRENVLFLKHQDGYSVIILIHNFII